MSAIAEPPYTGLLDSALPPDSVVRTTLPNGLRLLVRRDTSAPVVAIVTYVKAGYFDETDDEVGISHVLEHMYFKGTPARGPGEIARDTKASGGYLNAGTIYDHTHYYTVLPSSGFAAGLAIQADAYANSLIDAGELSRELEVIIEEAKRKTDSAGAVATETLFELLHDKHRIRRWRIGREAGLRTFTRDMVGGFYHKFYRPSNTVLSIVGDVDPDEARQLVERHYGSIAGGAVDRVPGPEEPLHLDPSFRYTELAGDIQQAEVVFGWRTPALLHDDTPPLDMLAAVLGAGRASRLYRAVRERRLASSIAAYDYTPGGTRRVRRARDRACRARARRGARRVGSGAARAGRRDHSRRNRARETRARSELAAPVRIDGGAGQSSRELGTRRRLATRRRVSRPAPHGGRGAHDRCRARAGSRPSAPALVAYRPSGAPRIAANPAEMREALDHEPPASRSSRSMHSRLADPGARLAGLDIRSRRCRRARVPHGVRRAGARRTGVPDRWRTSGGSSAAAPCTSPRTRPVSPRS